MRRCPGPRQSGFTLVETMVAVVVLMIVIGSIYETFRVASQSVSRAEERADVYQTARILLEQINAELCSAQSLPGESGGGLVGEDTEGSRTGPQHDTLTFLTTSHHPMSSTEAAGDLCRVTYTLATTPDGESLGLFVEEDFQPGLALSTGKREPVLLSKLVVGFNCRYLDRSTEEWMDEWTDREEMPAAVRVELALKPDRKGAKPVVIASTGNPRAVAVPAGGPAQEEEVGE